ncbi:hypothetical protein RDMS_08185 [Deinococcus sp. RL]|uniref:O-antigen polymerase n=1 Tax=Deinococcus sp. RL TaxID=1489678 RepID=UPI0004D86C50|nr:O-antigen polymerase [Deinococcus sp. RL]KEF34222.1 hypothetical protein RDMS_08185 [Deinococcus sp. RL]
MVLSFGVFLAFLGVLALSWGLTKDWRHPAVVYAVMWAAAFGLLSLPVVNYPALGSLTAAFVLLSGLSFVLSAYLGGRLGFLRLRPPAGSAGPRTQGLPSARALLLLALVGVGAGLWYYHTRFGLDVLLNNPAYVRFNDRDGSGAFGLLLLLPPVTLLLVALRYIRTRDQLPLTLLTLAVILGYMLVLPERSTLIVAVLWIAGMFMISDRRFRQRTGRYLGAALLVVLVGIGYFSAVSERTGKLEHVESVRFALRDQRVPTAAVDPYIYLTGSLPALDGVVRQQETRTDPLGVSRVAYPAVRLGQIVFPSAGVRASEAEEYTQIPFGFNTYTWLSWGVRDLGLWGAQLYFALVGLLSGLAYAYALRSPWPLATFVYSGVFAATALSIMTNRFSSLFFWAALAVVWSLLWLLRRTARRGQFPAVRSTQARPGTAPPQAS